MNLLKINIFRSWQDRWTRMSKVSANQIRISSDGCLEPDPDGDGELRIKIKAPELTSGLIRSVDGLSVNFTGTNPTLMQKTFEFYKEFGHNHVHGLRAHDPNDVGTLTEVLESTGQYLQFATSNSNGNVAGFVSDTFTFLSLDVSPVLRFKLKTGPTVANLRLWGGMTGAEISGTNTPNVNLLAFRYSTGASDTTFKCCAMSVGGTMSVSDSGVTVSANTIYDFIVDGTNKTSCSYYINGSLVATISSGLPATSSMFGAYLKITNLTTSSRSILFAKMVGTSL